MTTDLRPIIEWLLQGDPSIQYQVYRDLLNEERPELQHRVETEGWGKTLLSNRQANGHWGDDFYQPKWISTHYTLLDLRYLNLNPTHYVPSETINLVLKESIALDGGIKLGPSTASRSDVCVNGMFLNYASYFKTPERSLHSIVDALLGERMGDGGFNCRSTRSGAHHSSLHSTISVLEGLNEYVNQGHQYRLDEIQESILSAVEFILIHRLFKSDHTGMVIHKDFLKLSYPSRWKYDILRALSYFAESHLPWDDRMQDAIDMLIKKQNSNGTWNMQAAHPGKVHLVMEKAGQPSRWNTFRALKVLQHFKLPPFS